MKRVFHRILDFYRGEFLFALISFKVIDLVKRVHGIKKKKEPASKALLFPGKQIKEIDRAVRYRRCERRLVRTVTSPGLCNSIHQQIKRNPAAL